MIRQELALKLAANGCVRRWDPRVQVVYDNGRALRVPYIAERLRRYDRCLFMRFNALAERWELFRWRGSEAPTRGQIARIPPEEMALRSQFLWTVQDNDGSFAEPDARILRKIRLGDLFAKFGSSDAKAISDGMDAEDARQEARDKQEREDACYEEARRIAFEIRRMVGHHKVISHAR